MAYVRGITGNRGDAPDELPDYSIPAYPFSIPSRPSGVALYNIDLADVPALPTGPTVTALSAGGVAGNRALVVLLLALVILTGLVYLKKK